MNNDMSSRHAAELIEDGFAAMPNLLSCSAVGEMRRLSERARTSGELYMSGSEAFLIHPEITLPLVCTPRVLDVAEVVMGPFVQLDSLSLVGLRAGSTKGISWHRDVYGSVPRSSSFERPFALNLLIYLQDLTDSTGPFRTIPGSHREDLTMEDTERTIQHKRERLLYPRAGDGILIHNNLVHSRSENRSAADRLHISIVYTLSFLKQSIEFTAEPLFSIVRELRNSGSPRIARLFGYDAFGPARYNSGFLKREDKTWSEWIAAEQSGYHGPSSCG